jgi:hypothetical protein
VTLLGRFDESDAKAFVPELSRCLPELGEGFRAITDISQLEELTPEATPFVKQWMDLCNARGVSKVVRVIPDPVQNFGLTVMSYFHYDKDTSVSTCSSLAEAFGCIDQD